MAIFHIYFHSLVVFKEFSMTDVCVGYVGFFGKMHQSLACNCHIHFCKW